MELRTLPAFYQLMIEDGRIEDLSSYLEADEEWKNMIEPAVLECCREADGSIYLAPISSEAFSCAGIFWNEELFAKAEIEKFPETWEEFWECCDKLQARETDFLCFPHSLCSETSEIQWLRLLPPRHRMKQRPSRISPVPRVLL